MTRLVLVTLAAALGCSDENLIVGFDVPPQYRSDIARWSVSVIEPPEPGWSCEQLEFAERDEEAIRAVTRFETSISTTEDFPSELTIARDGDRLLMVEGTTVEGVRVLSGCQFFDQIVDDTSSLIVPLVPVVTLSVPSELIVLATSQVHSPIACRLAQATRLATLCPISRCDGV